MNKIVSEMQEELVLKTDELHNEKRRHAKLARRVKDIESGIIDQVETNILFVGKEALNIINGNILCYNCIFCCCCCLNYF